MTSNKITYYILIVWCLCIFSCKQPTGKTTDLPVSGHIIKAQKDTLIIDSNYSFEEAVEGSKAPQTIIDQLTLIQVQYYSFDSLPHQGQIACHQSIANDLKEIFDFILETRFPVGKVIPIVK